MGKMRVVLYGVGTMGQLSARLMLERGIEIVGAIGHVNNLGRDLGELIGWNKKLGVQVSADAEDVLTNSNADIAIMSVHESLKDSLVNLERCAKAGLNVISLSDQLYYPWQCYPETSNTIDTLAKTHSVTISAGGIQDIFWTNLVTVLSGASHNITSIEGVTTANADDFGPVLAKEYCIGEGADAFREMTDEEKSIANLFTIALEAQAAELGLNVTCWEQGLRPLIATTAIESKALGRVIEKGQIIGAATSSVIITKEGIELKGEIQLKVFDQNDGEINRWVINGEPTLRVECPELPGRIATCTAVINRLSDIIAAPPGLMTVDRLPKPKYKLELN